MINDEQRGTRYTAGLYKEVPMQSPQSINGDPQYAALCMFLAIHAKAGRESYLLDIGAGKGIVAHAMLKTDWPNGAPWYVAIDLTPPLDALQLPIPIHNHSKKISFREFIDKGIGEHSPKSTLAVLRNLLHELDILTTAQLLSGLNTHLPANSPILIQDMEDLPDAESRNAPWSSKRLKEVLHALGMNPQANSLESKSGTRWFNLCASTNRDPFDLKSIGDTIAKARLEQSNDLAAEAQELFVSQDASTARREIIIPRDRNTIDLQVRAWRSHNTHGTKSRSSLIPNTAIALNPGTAKLYFTPTGNTAKGVEEILGSLRSKDAVNMAQTISAATNRVWLWGYSNRHICDKTNAEAVAAAAKRGVDVRILLADPESDAAKARSNTSAYISPDRLIRDIIKTIQLARQWRHRGPWAEVRTTSTPPPASYFVIDDICIASYYTSLIAGTSSPSLVFRETGEESCLASSLIREFLITFDDAKPLDSSKSQHDLPATS